jgi:hypothetical protein
MVARAMPVVRFRSAGNVIKRSLGPQLMEQVSEGDIKRSIQYGLDHREEAIDYAIQFSRGLDLQKARPISSALYSSTSSRWTMAMTGVRQCACFFRKPTSRHHPEKLSILEIRLAVGVRKSEKIEFRRPSVSFI